MRVRVSVKTELCVRECEVLTELGFLFFFFCWVSVGDAVRGCFVTRENAVAAVALRRSESERDWGERNLQKVGTKKAS